jgi:hypothetical protein
MTHNQESQVGVSRNGIKPPTNLIGKWNNTIITAWKTRQKQWSCFTSIIAISMGKLVILHVKIALQIMFPIQSGKVYIHRKEKNTWKHRKLSPLTQSLKTSSFTSHDFQPSP